MSVRPSFLTATRIIGRSLGSNLSISGSSQSSGSEPSARLTLLRTSAVAKVYVAVELELHDDDGAPLVAARAHALDSFDCVDARFEHVRHVVVDDGGASALERRAHDDYREFDVRHPLDAHIHVRVSAEDYGGDRDDEDRYRPAQRNFRDFHEASSPCIVYIFSHT